MSELINFAAETLRPMVDRTLQCHLDMFTNQLVAAAEQEQKYTIHGQTFTVAVGGAALSKRRSLRVTAREALESHDGLDVVTEQYPVLAHRSVTDWNDALDEAWSAVRYRPEARIPEDRTVFGHIELLDAICKGTARYHSIRIV